MAATEIVIERMLNVVIPRLKDEINLYLNSEKEARSLASNLNKIKLLLEHAERNQFRDYRINTWLEELQCVAYDVEDALDDWETAVRSPLSDSRLSVIEKVRHAVQSPYSSYKRVIKDHTIVQEIKVLNETIEEIYNTGRNTLNLLPTSNHKTSEFPSSSYRITTTTSDFIRSHVHGREIDTDIVKSMLFKFENEQDDTIHVVSIVGQGGLGKTTLAKLVYNDEDVGIEFLVRIWVCVSNPFDEITIAKKILEQLKNHKPNVSCLEELKKGLKYSLREKPKFLLVLDDVWIDDHTQWESLNVCLSNGARGSKVLVTTRKQNTAEALGSTQVHLLQPMTHVACWSIISQIALAMRNEPQLEAIGKEIARKCDGLPLAAHFLAGLLRNKKHIQAWRRVLESGIWELENVEHNIYRHFFLSYDELDPATKRCFSYCAVFPKDFHINVEKLIRMWMAQGFLLSSKEDMEVQGQRIFDDLSQHSFFQDFQKDHSPSSNARVVGCKMHDIVHDFAQYLAKKECVIVEEIGCDKRNCYGRARHLFWLDKDKPETLVLSLIFNARKLRTFFCMNSLPSNFLNHLKCVRELVIRHCSLGEIPEEIGNLTHLRYLDLSDNGYIYFTPQSIFNLCDLQTLDLSGNSFLHELPPGINKLVKLRHFSMQTIMLSQGLGILADLRTLTGNIIVRKGDNNLRCLEFLNLIEGLLCLSLEGLDEEEDVNEAKRANLVQKKSVHSLSLKFDHMVRIEVVEALQPNMELLSLSISGSVLPKWITLMDNLRELEIAHVSSTLPSLGELQHLEVLCFRMLDMQYVGNELLGLKCNNESSSCARVMNELQEKVVAFPSLKTLKFQYCERWVEWQDISEEEETNRSITLMPYLHSLEFEFCRKLKVLPHRLLKRLTASSLQNLKCKLCTALLVHFGRGAKQENKLSHIPNITFTV